MRHLRATTYIMITLTAFGTASRAMSQEKGKVEKEPAGESPSAQVEEKGSPEAVLRTFMIALALGDMDAVKEHSLPNEDVDIFLTDERPPKEAVEQIQQFIGKVRIKRLKVGEQFKFPDGKTKVFEASDINEKRQLLSIPGAPAPFVLVKTEKGWKVDPQVLIAGRKAAKAAQEKQKSKPAPDK